MKRYQQGIVHVRQGSPAIMRLPYDSSMGSFNPLIHFRPEVEGRQFLEDAFRHKDLPYWLIVCDDKQEVLDILAHGRVVGGNVLYVVDGFGFEGKEGFTLVCTAKPGLTMEDLDILSHVSDVASKGKIIKYSKRNSAHYHGGAVFGTGIGQLEHGFGRIRLDDGTELGSRFMEANELVEGMHLVNLLWVEKLFGRKLNGTKYKKGDMLRGTIMTPWGFVKGHFLVWPLSDKLGFVSYGHKEVIHTRSRVFFGSMGELHGGQPYTDIQTVCNARLWPFLFRYALKFMQYVQEAANNEAKMRRMLLQFEGRYTENWILAKAVRMGLHMTDWPGLRRRLVKTFQKRLADCYQYVRIPLFKEDAEVRYAVVDPFIFDEFGSIDINRGKLPEGTIAGAGLMTSTVCIHRRPNAHPGEFEISQVVEAPYLQRFSTELLFFNAQYGVRALKKLGGGDYDDPIVIWKTPEVVDWMGKLPAYPLVETVNVEPEPARAPNRFAKRLGPESDRYTSRNLREYVMQTMVPKANIGYFVNPGMVSNFLGLEREFILNNLQYQIRGLKSLPEPSMEEKSLLARAETAFLLFQEQPRYALATVMRNLEKIIDSIKRDATDVSVYTGQVEDFWDNVPLIAECFTRGGFQNEGRLPWKRRGNNMPLVVKTPLDRTLDRIKDLQIELEDNLAMEEWGLLAPIEGRQMFIFDDSILPFAKDILSMYKMEMQHEMNAASSAEERTRAYKRVEEQVKADLGDDPELAEAIVSAMASVVYSGYRTTPEIDENTDRVRPYPDGILWGPACGPYMLAALKTAGQTGTFREVQFFRDTLHLVEDEMDVNVEAKHVFHDGHLIGTVEAPDGQYHLELGVIRISDNPAE